MARAVGYVHCQYEHADAIHLAVRDLIREECALTFDARSMLLTKLDIDRVAKLAETISKEGIVTRALAVEPPSRRPVVPATKETELQRLYASRLQELAARFQNYRAAKGPSIDADRIVRWLLQFGADHRHAMRILEHVQFWDRQALADAFAIGINRMDPALVDGSVFVPFGGGEKSSHLIGYLLQDVRERLPKRTIQMVSSVNDLERSGNVIFFDDISASGKQGVTAIKQLFGVAPAEDDVDEEVIRKARPEALELLRESRIRFLFITGHRDGLASVIETARKMVAHERVDGYVVAPAETDCFQAASRVFLSEEDALAAQEVFRQKGRRALQDKIPKWSAEKVEARALGYMGRPALTVFFYNAPTVTLTVLWKECTLPEHYWMPLFYRRTAPSASPALLPFSPDH